MMNSHRIHLTLAFALAAVTFSCRASRNAQEPTPSSASAAGSDLAAPSPSADASPATAADASNVGSVRVCAEGEAPTPELAPTPDRFAWRVDESAASSGQPAPVFATCQRLSSAADRARTTIGATLPADASVRPLFAELGRCHYAGAGAWVLDAGRARVRTVRESSTAVRVGEIDWTVSFVKADGSVLRSQHHGVLRSGGESIATVEWTLFHDLDRDGAAEAGFVVSDGNPSQGDIVEGRATLLSFANNALGAYARAPGADPTRAFDVDRDGDPDFVVRSAFRAGNSCGPSIFYGPDELWVLQPDGSFDKVGAASQAFVRAQCEETPQLPANFWVEGGGEAPFRSACWRYAGASAEEIQRMIDRDWPADGDDHCTSRDGMIASLRAAQPSFRLTTPCRRSSAAGR